MTYKYTRKIDEENRKRGDKVQENSLVDLSETPVFCKAGGSNYLGREDICEGIPAGVRGNGSMTPIMRPGLTSRPRRSPMQDLRLRRPAQTP